MSRLTACIKIVTLVCAGLTVLLSQSNSAAAFDRNKAQLFAVLPRPWGHAAGGPRRRVQTATSMSPRSTVRKRSSSSMTMGAYSEP